MAETKDTREPEPPADFLEELPPDKTDFITKIYKENGIDSPYKSIIFERGVASFFDSGKDFGSGEARLRKIKAFFAKCLVKIPIISNFLTKKVNNASLQYSKSKQLFLGSCVYNHSVDISCNGVKLIKNYNGKAVKVINDMLIHPSVWKHSYSKKFLKKITESIYKQDREKPVDLMLTVLSENDRKQLVNQEYQRPLKLSEPNITRIQGYNKVVVDIAPQISKKTKKYDLEQVYLSFSDITDQCRTGSDQINEAGIKNIYYLKYDIGRDETFMILMDIKREPPQEDAQEGAPNQITPLKVTFKKIKTVEGKKVEGNNKQTLEVEFSDFHNGVINIFTFINTVMSQSSKRTWCENIYAVLSNINPDLFKNSDNLKGEIKAFMKGYNAAVGVLIDFLDLFKKLQPHEDNEGNNELTNEQKKENGEFLIACLLKLKEMGDFLYIVEGANYMLNPQNDDDDDDKSVTIITSDKGLVVSKLLFPTLPKISLANYSFAPGGKQKLGIKLKNRQRRVSTLLRYDEQKGGGTRIDYKECIDYLINEIESDEIESDEQQYGLKFYNEYLSPAESKQSEMSIEPFTLSPEEKEELPKILIQLYNIFNPDANEISQDELSEVSDDFYISIPDELLERFDEKLAQLGENNIDDMLKIIENIYNDMLGEEAEAQESESESAEKEPGKQQDYEQQKQQGKTEEEIAAEARAAEEERQREAAEAAAMRAQDKAARAAQQKELMTATTPAQTTTTQALAEAATEKRGIKRGQKEAGMKNSPEKERDGDPLRHISSRSRTSLADKLAQSATLASTTALDGTSGSKSNKGGGNKRRPKKSRKKKKRKKKTRRKKR